MYNKFIKRNSHALFSWENVIAEIHVLWVPEKGSCDQCGILHEYTRKFTACGSCTTFCIQCWNGFIDDECTIISTGQWRNDISKSWKEEIALCLEYEYEDGTASNIAFWN